MRMRARQAGSKGARKTSPLAQLLLFVCVGGLLCGSARLVSSQSQTPAAQPESRWAFQSPRKVTVPSIPGVANPIDAFLLAKLREKGLDFAPAADRQTLLRRISFDLTGLPPAPDRLNEQYEQAVERLLASPQYGERWGRHWLDVVRFGETDGGEHNYERPNAWPYRDYVINAFNRDLPYNQFIREQIAGDILFPHDRDRMAATGFLVSGPWDQVSVVLNKDPVMRMTARMDELDDMVTTTCATFLGLTVNCARCHDHKFDPIPSKDYYRVAAAFSGVGFGEKSVATAEEREKYNAASKPLRSALTEKRAKLGEIEDRVIAQLLREKYRQLEIARKCERQRNTLNPIYNSNWFAPTTARYFRLVITGNAGSKARLDRLELKPAGHVIEHWVAPHDASEDKPVILPLDLGTSATVTEMEWSCNLGANQTDGAIKIYRLEKSEDGQAWSTIASSLDHVGRNEQDLPELSEEELTAALSPEAREIRSAQLKEIERLQSRLNEIPSPPALYAANTRKPEKCYLLERGSVQKPKEEVTPGALLAVGQLPSDFSLAADASDADRRLALANWITDPRNPVTARVIVNRVWYYHFGAGIVNTPSDFGANGDRPSHPELLDWLAASFVEHGWSIKWLHRLILSSRAYQQSSQFNAKAHVIDAGNRLVWRMPLKRMDAETLRDSILFVSGNLDMRSGGPSFKLHYQGGRGAFIYHALNNDGPAVWRRAVYRYSVRGGDRTMLDSFDCPDPSVATPQRSASNTAVQALALMNNGFVIRQAGLFAQRLEKELPGDRSAQVGRAYLLAVGRQPSSGELTVATKFLASQPLSQFCRALLNSNEFVFVP